MIEHGNFEEALQAAKQGCKVARRIWDKAYVFLQRGAKAEGINEDGSIGPVIFADHLMRRMEDGETFEPYQPTSDDLLCDDWEMVELGAIRMWPYVSTGVILAEPMTNIDAGDLLGKDFGEGEKEGYHVIYPDNYESWCPAVSFEKTHRPLERREVKLASFPFDFEP